MKSRFNAVVEANLYSRAAIVLSFPDIMKPEQINTPAESVVTVAEIPPTGQPVRQAASNVINFADRRATHEQIEQEGREAAAFQKVMEAHRDIAA